MGVNMAGLCIIDDDVVCEASKQEVIRRYSIPAALNARDWLTDLRYTGLNF